jgi:hypothetical protein
MENIQGVGMWNIPTSKMGGWVGVLKLVSYERNKNRPSL